MVLTVAEALPLWVYILGGLWGINTAAAKVALTEADVICFAAGWEGRLMLEGSLPQMPYFIPARSLYVYY